MTVYLRVLATFPSTLSTALVSAQSFQFEAASTDSVFVMQGVMTGAVVSKEVVRLVSVVKQQQQAMTRWAHLR